MTQGEFEKLVREAVETLPEKIRKAMQNIVLTIETKPTEEQLRKVGTKQGKFLLGLYEGIPQTIWGKGFGGNLPDKITIFKESIEYFASNFREAKELVKYVVWHEIAHHFGFSEKGVRKLEEKWRKKYEKAT